MKTSYVLEMQHFLGYQIKMNELNYRKLENIRVENISCKKFHSYGWAKFLT